MIALGGRDGAEGVWFRLGGALFEIVAIPEAPALEESLATNPRFHGLKDGVTVARGSAKAEVVAMLLKPSAQKH